MRPYYEDDWSTIYHGDCVEVLPTLDRADLVATDPPYGIGAASGIGCSVSAPLREYKAADWDDRAIAHDTMVAVVAAGKHAAIFGGNYYAMPPSSAWLVWDKCNGSNSYADAELVWTNYGIAVRIKRHLWHGMIRRGGEHREHPTQKPVDVMRWVIGLCPGSPSSVLDPFMGSGTTLRAAKDMGIRAIGIELDEQYCEMAAERLAQGSLFAQEST